MDDGLLQQLEAVERTRDDAPPFTALMTSTYARRGGRWRLRVYTQTPVAG